MKRFAAVVVFTFAVVLVGAGQPAGAAEPTVGEEHVLAAVPYSLFAFDSASDGTNQLVVWVTQRAETPQIEYLVAARVDPMGQVLAPGVIDVGATAYFGFAPQVSFDGTNFVVAWVAGTDIVVNRISVAGAVLDVPGKVVGTGPQGSTPNIASADSGRSLVVWEDDTGARGRELAPDGTVLGAAPISLDTSPDIEVRGARGVASNGDGFLVLVSGCNIACNDDGTDFFNLRTAVVEVDQAGTAGRTAIIAAGGLGSKGMAIASNGTDYAVFDSPCVRSAEGCEFSGDHDISMSRIRASDLAESPRQFVASRGPDQTAPDVAWNGFSYLVAYRRQLLTPFDQGLQPTGPVDVRASLVRTDGTTIAEGFLVTTDISDERLTVATFGGGRFGVGYVDSSASGPQLTMRTVTPAPK